MLIGNSKVMVLVVFTIAMFAVGCSSSRTGSKGTTSGGDALKQGGSTPTKTYAAKRLSSTKTIFDKRFVGTWIVEGSSAEFTINLKNDVVVFSGRDMEDKEYFQVHFIQWDKSTFKGSFLMPSTRHTTIVELSVLDHDKLRCEYSGDASGESIWWRK